MNNDVPMLILMLYLSRLLGEQRRSEVNTNVIFVQVTW